MEGIEVRITIPPDAGRDHTLDEIRWAMAWEYQIQAGRVLAGVRRETESPGESTPQATGAAALDPRHDGKVARGRDGHLFIDNDINQVMAQHSGQSRFTDAQLEHWRLLLENRIAWLERRGARYFFLVAPNAHSVYPEKLPEQVPSTPERPIHELMRHLRDKGSEARIVYPLEEISAAKPRPVYSKTSSYWSDLGAFIAYRALMEEIRPELSAVRMLELEDFEQSEEERPGDLGNKMKPPEPSRGVRLTPRESRTRLVSDNGIINNGRRIEFQGDGQADFTCLLLGDSFSAQLIPFLAESFGRLVFAHIPTLDHRLVEAERPDVVVTLLNERFMIRPPVDVPAKALEEREAEKREAELREAERQAAATKATG
jgi:acetyltransferase AlgX (SGNH hydrolase-like protein)